MAVIARSVAALRIFGDDLDPSEVSKLLGVEPTSSYRKGDFIGRDSGGVQHFRRGGAWLRSAKDCEPADVSAQVRELLSAATSNVAIWRELCEINRCDVFCGLFMKAGNEGEEIEPDVLLALGERGLRLGLDIYDSTPD